MISETENESFQYMFSHTKWLDNNKISSSLNKKNENHTQTAWSANEEFLPSVFKKNRICQLYEDNERNYKVNIIIYTNILNNVKRKLLLSGRATLKCIILPS